MKNKLKLVVILGAMCLLAACGGKKNTEATGTFEVSDVFTITDRGTVATGTVESGVVRVGDRAVVVKEDGTELETEIEMIELFRESKEEAKEGDIVGIQLEGLEKSDVASGDVLVIYGN